MIALALVAVALGALLAASTLTRLEAGRTWRDWQAAESPGWFTALQVVLVAMLIGGMILARPVALKVVLLGVPGGFCLVFLSVGIRRRWRARHEPRVEEEPLEEEFREPWHWNVIGFTAALVFALAVGYVVGLRGLELVGISVGGLLFVIGLETVTDRLEAWIRR